LKGGIDIKFCLFIFISPITNVSKKTVPFLAIFPTNSNEAAEVDLLSTPRVRGPKGQNYRVDPTYD
jgi:hypothetical protein